MATISNNDIARAIYLVSKDKTSVELHDINTKVVRFLVRRRLLSKTPDILVRLNETINHEEERVVAKVSSIRKLDEGLKNELISFLKERYKAKEVTLKEALDEKLLGGIKVEVGDEIIDLTIKNKIKKLQEYLTRKI